MPKPSLRTLVYKRTHVGDPDTAGQFGIHGCMGRVRGWKFEAVIGVGGVGAEPASYGIDGRVTWIGIGPHRGRAKDHRGPLVTFDRFVLFDRNGPLLAECAPRLAEHMYGGRVRVLMRASADEAREIAKLLSLAKNAPPSKAFTDPGKVRAHACRCGKRHSARCPNRCAPRRVTRA